MTSMLKSVAVGKLVLALEGGYNLKSISHSIAEAIWMVCVFTHTPRTYTLECVLATV